MNMQKSPLMRMRKQEVCEYMQKAEFSGHGRTDIWNGICKERIAWSYSGHPKGDELHFDPGEFDPIIEVLLTLRN